MEEIDVNTSLLQHDLFDLFKKQLEKDVEGAGMDAAFTGQLPAAFDALKQTLLSAIMLQTRNNNLLPALLYRVDISERQLKQYQQTHAAMDFEELVAELVIKRVLQKVILRKRFSK